MQSNITVYVNADRKLEIPAEIENQLKPGDRYQVVVSEDRIVFEKVKAGFDWEKFRQRRESIAPDPNPMTMEEICEIVHEVRREQRAETESQP